MKIDGTMLRRRRMELGLTSREVAKSASVSSETIKRLEERGDAGVLQVNTLEAIMNSLAFQLVDVIEAPPVIDQNEALLRNLGSYLFEQSRGITPAELAQACGATLHEVESTVPCLESKLRELGMCLHRSSVGISIVAIAQRELERDSPASHARYMTKLNNGDLSLLLRILRSSVNLNALAQSPNTTMSLQKLVGAGLIDLPTN